MKNLSLNNKGFSLVEILVALGVSSIVLLGVATFMRSGNNTFRVASEQTTLQNETQDLMNYLTNMIQSSSDAGWNNGIFYVLQPDALNESTGYVVHAMKLDEPNQTMYYTRDNVSETEFTTAKMASIKSALVKEDNIISKKVGYFEAIVERYAAKPTDKPDGSEGSDAPDSRTQSLSKIDVKMEIFVDGKSRYTTASIRPRNLITKKYFHQIGFDIKTAHKTYTKPSKKLARPNGDVEIGTDGYPILN